MSLARRRRIEAEWTVHPAATRTGRVRRFAENAGVRFRARSPVRAVARDDRVAVAAVARERDALSPDVECLRLRQAVLRGSFEPIFGVPWAGSYSDRHEL